ncbi:MAG: NADH-quinone oxidoreductase subunit NuoG [Roseiflexaceae bacterium]
MPDVNLIIDGHAVSVPAGTNLVEAARAVDVSIPVFCYHPKLKPVGMCRMCLVEVYTPRIDPATRQVVLGPDGQPQLALMMNKLQPACVTPVSDGMVVKTTTDKVKFAQRGVLEFLLTSHPLDCPVCDKGGECPLQNLTMQWGPEVSRFDYSDKVHFEKPIKLSDVIYLDRERCILCSRCVRFQDDVAGDPVLGFDNRGRSWEIISKSDPGFDSKFSGNTTDICPVGALTSADFRFRSRVWEVRSTPGVCTHCSVGCNISIDARHNKLMRVMPRENDNVNEIWLCDKGRMGMRFMESPTRITTPLVRHNGKLVESSWDDALNRIATNMASVAERSGSTAVAGLIGDDLPNEDLFAFRKLISETFGSANLDHRAGLPSDAAIDEAPLVAGVGVDTNLTTLGKGTNVLVVGADVEEEAPVYVLRLRGIQNRGGSVTVVNSFATKLGRGANLDIRIKQGGESSFAVAFLKQVVDAQNANGFDRRLRGFDELRNQINKYSLETLLADAGISAEQLKKVVEAYMGASNSIIVYGRAARQIGASVSQNLASAAMVTAKCGKANNGVIALSNANTIGATALGIRPGKGGASASEMWDLAEQNKLRAMLIVGLDPASQSERVAQALESVSKNGFLAVQAMFHNETTKRADVILPLMTMAERDGTVTNAERRVQRFRTAMDNASEMHAPWKVFASVAELAGVNAGGNGRTAVLSGWDYMVTSDVTDDIAKSHKQFANITYTSLDLTMNSWGRQANESVYYDGTSYTNTEGNGVQIATVADDASAPLNVGVVAPVSFEAKGEFTMLMQVPTRAYDGGTWSIDSKLASRQVPAHVIISMADASRWGIGIGDEVMLSSPVGSALIRAQIDQGLAEGQVLLPDVAGAPTHLALGAYTRVSVRRAE